jgi:hypothetical protein
MTDDDRFLACYHDRLKQLNESAPLPTPLSHLLSDLNQYHQLIADLSQPRLQGQSLESAPLTDF